MISSLKELKLNNQNKLDTALPASAPAPAPAMNMEKIEETKQIKPASTTPLTRAAIPQNTFRKRIMPAKTSSWSSSETNLLDMIGKRLDTVHAEKIKSSLIQDQDENSLVDRPIEQAQPAQEFSLDSHTLKTIQAALDECDLDETCDISKID